jgi:hypothetical protein
VSLLLEANLQHVRMSVLRTHPSRRDKAIFLRCISGSTAHVKRDLERYRRGSRKGPHVATRENGAKLPCLADPSGDS